MMQVRTWATQPVTQGEAAPRLRVPTSHHAGASYTDIYMRTVTESYRAWVDNTSAEPECSHTVTQTMQSPAPHTWEPRARWRPLTGADRCCQ
jgi:hypothetical protein